MKYTEKLQELQVELCNKIENTFLNEEIIELNNPFDIYITVVTLDDAIKERIRVSGLESGKYLNGKDSTGDEWEGNIYQLEDIFEAARLLDEVSAGHYKILAVGDDSPI